MCADEDSDTMTSFNTWHKAIWPFSTLHSLFVSMGTAYHRKPLHVSEVISCGNGGYYFISISSTELSPGKMHCSKCLLQSFPSSLRLLLHSLITTSSLHSSVAALTVFGAVNPDAVASPLVCP